MVQEAGQCWDRGRTDGGVRAGPAQSHCCPQAQHQRQLQQGCHAPRAQVGVRAKMEWRQSVGYAASWGCSTAGRSALTRPHLRRAASPNPRPGVHALLTLLGGRRRHGLEGQGAVSEHLLELPPACLPAPLQSAAWQCWLGGSRRPAGRGGRCRTAMPDALQALSHTSLPGLRRMRGPARLLACLLFRPAHKAITILAVEGVGVQAGAGGTVLGSCLIQRGTLCTQGVGVGHQQCRGTRYDGETKGTYTPLYTEAHSCMTPPC
eukprot:scaffold67258_cov17-Tisochrysis_lutea.AAC.2